MTDFVAPASTPSVQGRSTFGTFCFKMRERLMSRLDKHGPLNKNYPVKVDALDSAIKRIEAYVATGNTVYLVDLANFAYIEYEYPSHPNAHYEATDPNEPSPELVIRVDGPLKSDMG